MNAPRRRKKQVRPNPEPGPAAPTSKWRCPTPDRLTENPTAWHPVRFNLWRRQGQLPPPKNDKLYSELWELAESAIEGSDEALERMTELTRYLCNTLEQIDTKRLRNVAQIRPTWPMNVSPCDKDIRRLRDYLRTLDLGANDCFTPYAGRKVDRKNLWTEYAESALWTLKVAGDWSRATREWIRSHPTAKRVEYKGRPRGGRTTHRLITWEVPGEPIRVLYDWQEMAADLPPHISRAPSVFNAYLRAAKLAIRGFWSENDKAREEAFEKAKPSARFNADELNTDGEIVDAALKGIRQALMQLAEK